MEITQTNAIFSFPTHLWTRIFECCFHSKNNEIEYPFKIEDGIFVWFVALKRTSKQLNLLLDDEFFFDAVKNCNLLRVFRRKKIPFLVKQGSYDAFKTFNALDTKISDALKFTPRIYRHNILLLLVVQFTDVHFLKALLADEPSDINFSRKSVVLALRRANDREANDMTLVLWPRFLKNTKLSYIKKEHQEMITDALTSGRKLNFDAFVGFDEWVAPTLDLYHSSPPSNMFLKLLSPLKKPAVVQIPEGKLLNSKCLTSKSQFNTGKIHIYIQQHKITNHCAIIHRERYSSQQKKIPIKKEKNPSGDTFTYDDLTTSNFYELIVNTSLADKLFGTYPHMYVAVTDEALNKPLDEQPWFVGVLSENERNALVADAPNESFFFVYCNDKMGFILQRSNYTLQYECQKKLKRDENIARHLARDGIVFGISNYLHSEYLKKYKLAKFMLEGDLQKVKQYTKESNLDLSSIFEEPSLLKVCVSQPTINEEILLWLLKNAPVAIIRSMHSTIEQQIIEKCSEDTIKAYFQLKKIFSEDSVEFLCKRGVSFELMMLVVDCVSSQHSHHILQLMAGICGAVAKKQFKYAADYKKRLLITAAWKYGNEDNYFKLLPKELIDQILSYEDIDEPLYFQLLFQLATHLKESDYLKFSIVDGAVGPFMRFWWKYWGTLYSSESALTLARCIAVHSKFGDDSVPKLLYWFKRLILSSKILQPSGIDNMFHVAAITYHCLKSSNADTADVFELLLKHNLVNRVRLLFIGDYMFRGIKYLIPATWLAVLNRNLPAIKLLIQEDLLPDSVDTIRGQKTLADLCHLARLDGVMEYINQCRKEK